MFWVGAGVPIPSVIYRLGLYWWENPGTFECWLMFTKFDWWENKSVFVRAVNGFLTNKAPAIVVESLHRRCCSKLTEIYVQIPERRLQTDRCWQQVCGTCIKLPAPQTPSCPTNKVAPETLHRYTHVYVLLHICVYVYIYIYIHTYAHR